MEVYPAVVGDERGGVTGGVDLFLPPPEHSHTVHCDQAHNGKISGSREASGVTGVQVVVVLGKSVLELDVGSGF